MLFLYLLSFGTWSPRARETHLGKTPPVPMPVLVGGLFSLKNQVDDSSSSERCL